MQEKNNDNQQNQEGNPEEQKVQQQAFQQEGAPPMFQAPPGMVIQQLQAAPMQAPSQQAPMLNPIELQDDEDEDEEGGSAESGDGDEEEGSEEDLDRLQVINTSAANVNVPMSAQDRMQEEAEGKIAADQGQYKRLMISKIELENFKSYFGTKVIGPLHKNFTAVVGPNGSGKSNLIESLLFVFGKRAKQMRLNKLSELIHKSADHPDCLNASVRVSFQEIYDQEDDPDLYNVIQGTQFTVSRQVNRSSQSKYFLNNVVCDYQAVVTLLKAKGIDLDHNRFLILQGEVEQISLMRPKAQNQNETGLLEYLEDIIGSNRYVEEIETLERVLEDCNEKRIEQTNRVKASQHELKGLDEARLIAVKWIKKERKSLKLLTYRFFMDLGDGVRAYNEFMEKIQQSRDEIKGKRDEKKEKFVRNSALVSEINNLHSQIDESEKREKELKKDFELLERQDIMINNEKKAKITEISKTMRQIEDYKKQKLEITEKCNQIEAENPQIEAKLAEQQALKSEKEQTFEKLDDEVRQQTEQLRREREQIEAPLNQIHSQMTQIKTDIESKKAEIESIENRRDKIQGELDACNNQVSSYKTKLNHANEEFTNHQQQYKSIQQEMDTENQREGSLRSQNQQLESEIREISEKLNYMRQSRQQQMNRHKITVELKKAQKQGILSGVHGRLGDCGTIDEKFDIPISTACSYLDYIVVDTIKEAEKCIDYMKAQKVGRAAFICLDRVGPQIQHLRVQPFQAPQNSQRLYELIRPSEEKFQNAFYFALRNTLVCQEIMEANHIAFKLERRHRVVTLTGELIELSGTIAGGGKPRQGGMSHKLVEEFTDNQIQEAEDNLRKKREDKQQAIAELNQLNSMYSEINHRKIGKHREMEKANVERNTYSDFHKDAERKQAKLDEESAAFMQNVEKIPQYRVEMSQNSDTLTELNPKVQELKRQLEAKQAEIMEVGGNDYRRLKDELDQVAQTLAQTERLLNKNKHTVQNSAGNLRKLDQEIQRGDEDIEKLSNQKLKLHEEIQKNETTGQKLLVDSSACQKVKEECQKLLEEKKNDFLQMKKEMNEIDKIENELKEELDKLMKERTICKDKCDRIKQNIRSNRLKFIKNLEEYGEDHELNENPDGLEDDEERGGSSAIPGQVAQLKSDRRSSVAPLQVERLNESRVSREGASQRSSMQIAQMGAQPGVCQGYEYHLQHTKIDYTFKDEEIAFLAQQKPMIDKEIQNLRIEMDEINPNVQILEVYKEKRREYLKKERELRHLEENLKKRRQEHEALRSKRLDQFKEGFQLIAKHVKQIYRLITNGGDADLETIDQLDPFSEGVMFQVRPKNKSWKQMSKLSGGEKTLSSLSLIFALHIFKPSPLYCMDEIDAALDYKNVAIVGKYIKEGVCKRHTVVDSKASKDGAEPSSATKILNEQAKVAQNSQFIIISLRNNMFELADKLVGIYKTHDVTQTITINPNAIWSKIQAQKADQVAAIAAANGGGQDQQEQPKEGAGNNESPAESLILATPAKAHV